MKILMPVSFQAQGGGLHDHVLALAKGARTFGNSITVAGAPGLFLDLLAANGVETITVDLTDIPSALHQIQQHASSWDIVHAHPFAAREFAQHAARHFGAPLVVTIHGWYDDHIERWYHEAAAVIATTPAITARLHGALGASPARIVTIPNGIKVRSSPVRPESARSNPLIVSVVSRVDRDFAPVMSLVERFVEDAQAASDTRWRLVLAGTGTHLVEAAKRLARLAYRQAGPEIHLRGWVDGAELEALYAMSFATIAPGRSAVDAMASGVPTVMTRQIGTYSLIGADDPVRMLTGFPGAPASLALYDLLSGLASEPDRWEAIARATQRATRLFFSDDVAQRQTNAVYEFVKLASLTRES